MGDPLFVRDRTACGRRPGARSRPRLRQGLTQLQEALSPTAFDPGLTSRRFTVAAGPYVGAILMPEVLNRIRAEAPASEFRVHAIDRWLGEALESGRMGLAIGSFGHASPHFDREVLFHETAVWAVSARHPAAASDHLKPGNSGRRSPRVLYGRTAGSRHRRARRGRRVGALGHLG